MNVENQVKLIVIDVLKLKLSSDEMRSDIPFFEMGLHLDSLAGLRIVLNLEKKFGFETKVGDLTREVFSDINHLVDFVNHKMDEGGA